MSDRGGTGRGGGEGGSEPGFAQEGDRRFLDTEVVCLSKCDVSLLSVFRERHPGK